MLQKRNPTLALLPFAAPSHPTKANQGRFHQTRSNRLPSPPSFHILTSNDRLYLITIPSCILFHQQPAPAHKLHRLPLTLNRGCSSTHQSLAYASPRLLCLARCSRLASPFIPSQSNPLQ